MNNVSKLSDPQYPKSVILHEYINFFCNEDHLKEWQRPSTWTGNILPLPQALAVAVDRFRPIIDVYGLVYRGSESVANPTGVRQGKRTRDLTLACRRQQFLRPLR